MDEKARVIDIYNAALAAVDPYGAVMRQREVVLDAYGEGRFSSLCVIGFGKAARGMVRAVLDVAGDKVTGGVAITKYGHWPDPGKDRIRVYEAGHPIPDENGVKATRQAVALAQGLDEKGLLVCLISGGGSALLVAPAPGILLAEKQRTIDLLLRAGADIHELNAVRKHLSAVKGGRMAQIAHPARVVSLILSDVIDDRLDIIASGPTVPDETTYADALGVIEKYLLSDEVPRNVYDHLVGGSQGRIPDAPGKGDPIFDNVKNIIVGSNGQAVEAAVGRCGELGIDVVKADRVIRGEARDAGRWLVNEAREILRGRKGTGKEVCLISGGETTVTVRGSGTGGRNTELALAAAMEMEGVEGMTLLSAGTDGTDGPTDAAGAIVDGRSIERGRRAGLDPRACLSDNDSYRFLAGSGDLFVTGPTGTNVMDIQVVLLKP